MKSYSKEEVEEIVQQYIKSYFSEMLEKELKDHLKVNVTGGDYFNKNYFTVKLSFAGILISESNKHHTDQIY